MGRDLRLARTFGTIGSVDKVTREGSLMSLFDGAAAPDRRERRGWPRRIVAGTVALIVALVALFVMSFLPSDFVLERPGPVYNTLGEVESAEGEQVPLVEVDGAESYDTTGSLSLTTVEVLGNREHPISWIELALAWMDPSRAVVPIDAVFPEGVTSDERDERNAVMMTDSQSQAAAAALRELGYDVQADLRVVGLPEGSPADGIVEEGDRILAAGDAKLADVAELRDAINDAAGDPVELAIERDGERQTIEVTPERSVVEGEESWAVGVSIGTSYDLPVDVSIQLDSVGGPSAGTMFALGIIDAMTPGSMTGGEHIAGTGTITADGEVGPIGGIRQKMFGAHDAGHRFFLAPTGNCDAVIDHVPDGMRVVSIDTLDDATRAVEMIAEGEVSELPSCAS